MTRTLSVFTGVMAVLVQAVVCPSVAQQLVYDREYPFMSYSTHQPEDPVSRFVQRVESGQESLSLDDDRGYLPALLEKLGISTTSQMLVFSGTSFQENMIRPAEPRAIYFSEDTYVAWVQGAERIELASLDPVVGPVFYTLGVSSGGDPEFVRETALCLQCHDSYGMSGGGVPRLLFGSGIPDKSGSLVGHEAWVLTDQRTPLERRWGGWYVTGTHGAARHMGNLFVETPNEVASLDPEDGANLTDLSELLDIGPYVTPHSDIVALLIAEHQIHVTNVMIRAHWETRAALEAPDEPGSTPLASRIEAANEPLLDALLLVDEARLPASVVGNSGFKDVFEAKGPFDREGRSLRQLQLDGRLFRHPLSFLIHSPSFAALPTESREYIYQRLGDVLTGRDRNSRFDHLGVGDRAALLEILRDTSPEFDVIVRSLP